MREDERVVVELVHGSASFASVRGRAHRVPSADDGSLREAARMQRSPHLGPQARRVPGLPDVLRDLLEPDGLWGPGRLQLEVAVAIRTIVAPGRHFVGTLVDRLDLLAAVASPPVLLGLDADHVVIVLGAGRLVDLAQRLAGLPWRQILVVGSDLGEPDLSLDTLLAVLEALYDAHRGATRLSYIHAELVYDAKAAMKLVDGVARLHLWCGRTEASR